MSGNPIAALELAFRKEVSNKLAETIEPYVAAYAKREAGIGAFLDDEGELKEGESYERYDSHSYDAWSDSHGDLGSLLADLELLLR
ncbi:hypothetical protein [Streptomyces sp. NPDC051546]|uniref:hypothetical protein n=1 Tax=Streptomyces sp. NPDC051546 TaxID=3365655 RepID=UPI0037A632B7